MADVAKATVFMTDMDADFQAMNAVFKRVFPTSHRPAPPWAWPIWPDPA